MWQISGTQTFLMTQNSYRPPEQFGLFPPVIKHLLIVNVLAFLLQLVAQIDNLAGAPLIEVSSSHTEWMNWQAWLERMGAPARRLERPALFNTYPLSIYAAVDGVGVALGWGHLVDQLINSGKLVRPLGAAQVRTAFGYYLLTPQNHPAFPSRTEVADWLKAVSAARVRYGDQ